MARHSLPPEYGREWTLTADNTGEVEQLLEAAFSDWVDFLFIPTPKPFVIYADHDEYTTFYANTKCNLNPMVEPFARKGFNIIEGYRRAF